jgi:hypothetical protein
MQKMWVAALLSCVGLDIGGVLCASASLLIENENAISAMTPMRVAPWLVSLSKSVRERLSSLLPAESLESFDRAIGLLFEARIDTKVLSHLRVTRKSLHRQASQYVKQLKHDAAKEKKQGNSDIKRIKNDCADSIRTYGARLKDAFDVLNLLEHEIKKAFKWFAHRRDVYNKTGRYKALVSVDSVKNYSFRKRASAEKEIQHIIQASCVLESLSKAYERARLALTVGGDV